jgi:hypothetical protein
VADNQYLCHFRIYFLQLVFITSYTERGIVIREEIRVGKFECVQFGIEDELFDHGSLTEIEMVTHQEMGLYREVN